MSRLNVRALREALGLSLAQFAREVGVARRSVIRWEQDSIDPSPLALQQLKRLQSEIAEDGRTVTTPRPSTAPKRRPYEPTRRSSPEPDTAPSARGVGVVPARTFV